ncbi:acyl carrier protein [Streptomyces sp. LZ34]
MSTEAALSPITTDAVRELLSDRKVFAGVPADLGEDAELVLDSLGLVWLLHVVEERYGLVVEPTDEEIFQLTSLRLLTEYLRAAQTNRAEEAEGAEEAKESGGAEGAEGGGPR